jgi:glycosyltransferase involved in cell wall biosynthesis
LQPDFDIKISVICTVRNDPAGVSALLEALAGQTRPPDEIVVVDGGSDEATRAVLDGFDPGPSAYRWLSRGGVNIAAGRNIAIAEATCDVIACTDAGCVPDPNWLEELVAPFRDPAVMVVGGGYRVSARTALERVVGLLSMPGELTPIDPPRFNPSARSLAFRREAWTRAGGFPDWLMTAEDTLFACKLRRNGERFVHAEQAVVRWRPRRTWAAVWRQFRGYARGEAHIGRGEDSTRFWRRRYAVSAVCMAFALIAAALAAPIVAGVGCVVALAAVIGPVWRRSWAVARRSQHPLDFPRALVLNHWLVWANLRGFALGQRDRRANPHMYVARLRDYWGAAPVASVPTWNMPRPPTPNTLIVTWYWPPQARACTTVLANLFAPADPGSFHVLTRSPGRDIADPLPLPTIPVTSVRRRGVDAGEGTLRHWLHAVVAVWRMIRTARKLHAESPFQRVLGVYPHRFGLLAGWLIARTTGAPLVAYMHDLCAETLMTRSTLKRMFWTWVDRKALRNAFLVIAPTREFALHYRSRGILDTWVLPHCNPPDEPPAPPQRKTGRAKATSCGCSMPAASTKPMLPPSRRCCTPCPRARIPRSSFFPPPTPIVPADQRRWETRTQARRLLADADVLVVALAGDAPYPREIQGCFPSKMVDYLAAGKPLLAIVPSGCFVDRFVRATGCGVVVNSQSPADIARVIHLLRDARARKEMGRAAAHVSRELAADRWLPLLCERLALGATVDPSTPPFPKIKAQRPKQNQLVTDPQP